MNYRRGHEPRAEKPVPVIFALTLRACPSRTDMIRSQLERLGHPYEIFYGTDGAAPGALRGVPCLPHLRDQQPGLVGCAWSHWRIAAEIVSRGLPYGIIVEDDTVIQCTRQALDSAIRDLPAGFDLAVLHRSSHEQAEPYHDLPWVHTRHWMVCRKPSQGTHFFILSQQGARLLMAEMLPISEHIDMWFRTRREWAIFQHRTGLACHSFQATASIRDGEESGIPRVIHQIWLGGGVMPERMQVWGRTWDALNERSGYRRFVWTEADFEEVLPYAWRQVIGLPVVTQSDIMRLAILDRFGGVYADADFECLREIAPLMQGRLIWGEEGPGVCSNAFLAAERGHHIISAMLEEALARRHDTGPPSDITGPGLLRRVAEALNPAVFGPLSGLEPVYASGEEIGVRREGIVRLNSRTVYPYAVGEPWIREDHPQAAAVHHWEASWWPEPRAKAAPSKPLNHHFSLP